MEQKVETFTQSADKLLSKVESLTQNIQTLEKSTLQDFQKELLKDLYEFRDIFCAELSQLAVHLEKSQPSTNSPSVIEPKVEQIPLPDAQVESPIKKVEKANDADLVLENQKLKYRVNILTRNLREALENKELKTLQDENNRLKYRIKILLRNFKKEDNGNQVKKTAKSKAGQIC